MTAAEKVRHQALVFEDIQEFVEHENTDEALRPYVVSSPCGTFYTLAPSRGAAVNAVGRKLAGECSAEPMTNKAWSDALKAKLKETTETN